MRFTELNVVLLLLIPPDVVYHANSVRWLKEYGTVTGLANLNSHFGVNTTWHSLAAVIDNTIWESRAVWLLPTLGYVSTSGYFFWEIAYSKTNWQKLSAICILCWTFCNVLTWGFPSLHYDFVPLIYNAILIFETFFLTLENNKDSNSISKLLFLAILATASFVLKPMGAISVLFIGMYIVYMLYKSNKLKPYNLLIIGIIPFTSFCIWLTRNVLLSGWPLFPSLLLSLDLKWTVPTHITKEAYTDILYWARLPGPNYRDVGSNSFMFWFIPWLKNSVTSIRFIFVGTIPLLLGSILWIINFKQKSNKYSLYFFSWSLTSVLFWFYLAPDIRFGDGIIFAYLICGLSFFLINNESKFSNYLNTKYINSCVINVIFSSRWCNFNYRQTWPSKSINY